MERRRRRRREGSIEPNLTPLLDVVLQLIAFFLMLVHFGARLEGSAEGVRLPRAAVATPGSGFGDDRLMVAIDAAGRLRPEGSDRALVDAEVEAWWRGEAMKRRDEGASLTEVVVRADRGATYGAVRRLLGTGQSAGFRRFSLIVLREVR